MPNSEYYNVKSSSMLNLSVVFLIVTGLVAAGIIFLPSFIQEYLSYDFSQITIKPPLVLPASGSDGDIIPNKEQLNDLQLPQSVPLNISESIFGRANPFAPL